MAGNSWSINIVKGKPCKFEPDVYYAPGTPKPTVLTAETNDSISWNNLSGKVHQICTGQGADKTQLTNRIPKNGPSDAYSPQSIGTINYYCCLHSGETGTIEVVS